MEWEKQKLAAARVDPVGVLGVLVKLWLPGVDLVVDNHSLKLEDLRSEEHLVAVEEVDHLVHLVRVDLEEVRLDDLVEVRLDDLVVVDQLGDRLEAAHVLAAAIQSSIRFSLFEARVKMKRADHYVLRLYAPGARAIAPKRVELEG